MQSQEEAEILTKWSTLPSIVSWVPPFLGGEIPDASDYLYHILDQRIPDEWVCTNLPSKLGNGGNLVPKCIDREVKHWC